MPLAKTNKYDETAVRKAVAAEVRSWVARYEVSQVQIADALGLTPAAVSQRLRGKTPFTFADLLRVASLMGISLHDLLGDALVETKKPQRLFDAGASVGSGGGTRSPDLTIMSFAVGTMVRWFRAPRAVEVRDHA